MRNWGRSRKGQRNTRNACSKYWKKGHRFPWTTELHLQVYLSYDCYVWAHLQVASKRSRNWMEHWLSKSFWEDQRLFERDTYSDSTCLRETTLHVFDCAWRINGMHVETTRRNRKKRAYCLLLEQNVYQLRNQIFTLRKNLLRSSSRLKQYMICHTTIIISKWIQ